MKLFILIVSLLVVTSAQAKVETRCGWVSVDSDYSGLTDADGYWPLAEAEFEIPGFYEKYPQDVQAYIKEEAAKYFCACMDVQNTGQVNYGEKVFDKIFSISPKNLSSCINDKKLTLPELQ